MEFLKVIITITWLHHVACGTLVPLPGIEPVFPALEVQNLNLPSPGKSIFIAISEANNCHIFIIEVLRYGRKNKALMSDLG